MGVLPTMVVILRRKFPSERSPKGPQKCTIVDDCVHIAESGLSGITKPRFCQTYVLQFGAFHENDGNHENHEDNSDSHKEGG